MILQSYAVSSENISKNINFKTENGYMADSLLFGIIFMQKIWQLFLQLLQIKQNKRSENFRIQFFCLRNM